MSRELPSTCRRCRRQFAENRKYCSEECRSLDEDDRGADPTPEEIREMCRQIREAGGVAWEKIHTCYPTMPVLVRTVAIGDSRLARL